MTTWKVTKEFRLDSGHFNREALSTLTKQSVRMLALDGYVYTATIEADDRAAAYRLADSQLLGIIAPYGVLAHIYASAAVEVEVDGT